MTAAERVVAAARATLGVRFRLHGRDPAFGLDCVGVAATALRAGGLCADIPADYPLRGGDATDLARAFAAAGLRPAADAAPGDLLLFAVGSAQWHLGIQVPGAVVHADAALRRVVERPAPVPWRMIGAWRLQEE